MAMKRAKRDVAGKRDPVPPFIIFARFFKVPDDTQEIAVSSDKKYKKVVELAEKLAIASMSAKSFEHFDSEDLAQYCWDVAATLYGFSPDDLDADEDEE